MITAIQAVHLFVATAAGLVGSLRIRHPLPALAALAPNLVRNDPNRLFLLGEELLQRSHRDRQPLTLAVFDLSDLPELQSVFKGDIATRMVPLIAAKLQGIAPLKGVVIRTGPTRFAVLLPSFDSARARHAIREALGKACCLEFDIGDSEILLVADYSVQTIRVESASVQEVYQRLCLDLVMGKQHATRRENYLKLERESHTPPMRLRPLLAPTIPVPLGMR